MYSLNIIMYSTNIVHIKTVDDEVRGRDLTRKENTQEKKNTRQSIAYSLLGAIVSPPRKYL